MVEEVYHKLWNHLVELDLAKLLELDLLANVWLVFLVGYSKYLLILLLLLLELFEELVLMAKDFDLFSHVGHEVQHLGIRIVSVLGKSEVVLEMLHPLVHNNAIFGLTLFDFFRFRL